MSDLTGDGVPIKEGLMVYYCGDMGPVPIIPFEDGRLVDNGHLRLGTKANSGFMRVEDCTVKPHPRPFPEGVFK